MTHYSDDFAMVKDFALQDRKALLTFLRLGECYEPIKAHLRNRYVQLLTGYVKSELAQIVEGWQLEDHLTDRWNTGFPTLSLFKSQFKSANYFVALQCQNKLRDVRVGIVNGCHETENKPVQKPSREIWDTLNKNCGQGAGPDAWWSWYKFLDPKYRDWNNKQTLLNMLDAHSAFRSEKTIAPIVEDVGEEFVNIYKTLSKWFEQNQ